MHPSNDEYNYIATDTNTTLEFVQALRRSLNSHTGTLSTRQRPRLILDEFANIRREYNRYLSRQVVALAGTRGGKGITTPTGTIFEQESNDIDYDMI